jgi:hypothetical protein
MGKRANKESHHTGLDELVASGASGGCSGCCDGVVEVSQWWWDWWKGFPCTPQAGWCPANTALRGLSFAPPGLQSTRGTYARKVNHLPAIYIPMEVYLNGGGSGHNHRVGTSSAYLCPKSHVHVRVRPLPLCPDTLLSSICCPSAPLRIAILKTTLLPSASLILTIALIFVATLSMTCSVGPDNE